MVSAVSENEERIGIEMITAKTAGCNYTDYCHHDQMIVMYYVMIIQNHVLTF